MSEPFIAEVRMVACNFAPRGWAFCNGQVLPIAQNTALFSLIGTNFGGDGRTSTGLPDLQGRSPMHPGRGPGLPARRLGQKISSPTALINQKTEMVTAASAERGLDSTQTTAVQRVYPANNDSVYRASLGVNFVIALMGLYPSRG